MKLANQLLILFCISLLLNSCQRDFPQQCDDCGFICLAGDERNVIRNNCSPEDACSFRLFENSKIDTKVESGISLGELNVYQVTTLRKGAPGFTQDVENTLLFEMNPNIKTFRLNGQDFAQLNVHFKKVSLNNNISFVRAKLGCIAGEEQAPGVWFMFGKVTVPIPDGEEEIKFEARFD